MASIIGEANIRLYQLKCLKVALETRIKLNGKFRLTRADYMGTARALGYKGRTAKALLADLLAKNPGL